MLLKSDLIPLPFGGRYRREGSDDTMGARDAVTALMHGAEVKPADEKTAELVATRLATRGNETRAQMVLRAAGVVDAADVVFDAADVDAADVVFDAADVDAADVVFDDPEIQAGFETKGAESETEETPAPVATATAVPAEMLNAAQDELAVEEETAPAEPETQPEPAHADQATDIKAMVEDAGDDLQALARVGDKVGLERNPRWGAPRLRREIFEAAAKRTAKGKAFMP